MPESSWRAASSALRIADLTDSSRDAPPEVAPVTAKRVAWLTPFSSER